MSKNYDAIIIGAGSIGTPTSISLSENKVKTLVIEQYPSCGQGSNKAAIGGVRATHSDKGKILSCLRSIEIFSTWKEKYGVDIHWITGGYLFPVYRDEEEKTLKDLLVIQKQNRLNIDWVNADKVKQLVPGINPNNLRGGSFSPEDGNCSPMMSVAAFYQRSKELGTDFVFNETVVAIETVNGKISKVKTNKAEYNTNVVINAAGAFGKEVSQLVGYDVPINPDCHEGGITEQVKKFFEPMVVDIRPDKGSKNYYFYQNHHGQIVFCITPEPPIYGLDRRPTSVFLPQVSKRMIDLMPLLKNIKIRRTWRGLYPMTPDGNPIVGKIDSIPGYYVAVGMCGQGFMLGPGLGEVLQRLVTNDLTSDDKTILEVFNPNRSFGAKEKLA